MPARMKHACAAAQTPASRTTLSIWPSAQATAVRHRPMRGQRGWHGLGKTGGALCVVFVGSSSYNSTGQGMSVDFVIVSIGALSSNPFWKEPPGVRTAHATTTLVRDRERVILVDPSLPAAALDARLFERTGLRCGQVTDVFCTTLRPTHRRSIAAFEKARWWCGGEELTAYGRHLEALASSAGRLSREDEAAVAADGKLLRRFAPAEEKLTARVHLFPLVGPSVGSCGLLLAGASRTTLIAGDAALTVEHVLAGRVWEGCADAQAAMESLKEIVEIADVIVCGHDNFMLSPLSWKP